MGVFLGIRREQMFSSFASIAYQGANEAALKVKRCVSRVFLLMQQIFEASVDALCEMKNFCFGTRIVDRILIQPEEIHENFVGIPDRVAQALDQISGVEVFFRRLPKCLQEINDTSEVLELPLPIMKGITEEKSPLIAMKLRSVDRDEVHPFVLIRFSLYEEDKCIWGVGGEQAEHEPQFLIGNKWKEITHREQAVILREVLELIPQFQKLFYGRGIATDINGNRWKLDF